MLVSPLRIFRGVEVLDPQFMSYSVSNGILDIGVACISDNIGDYKCVNQ